MSAIGVRALLTTALLSAALALVAPSVVNAAWNTANAGAWNATAVAGTGITATLDPTTPAWGPVTTSCTGAFTNGSVYTRLAGSGVNIANASLYGTGCARSGRPIIFRCTGGSVDAYAFIPVGGSLWTWQGATVYAAAHGLYCFHREGNCIAALTSGDLNLRWVNASGTSAARVVVGGGQSLTYGTNGNADCTTYGTGQAGVLTISGTASSGNLELVVDAPASAAAQPAIWYF